MSASVHLCDVVHAAHPADVCLSRRWLIAIAFWLSGGFIKSGLGNRVAYYIVSIFGKTTLGLAYSLVFAEALLAPAIPSVAARAGGIFFPLVKALCLACGSDPVRYQPRFQLLTSIAGDHCAEGLAILARLYACGTTLRTCWLCFFQPWHAGRMACCSRVHEKGPAC